MVGEGAGRAREREHAGCAACGRRMLRDELGRQIVVEVRDEHQEFEVAIRTASSSACWTALSSGATCAGQAKVTVENGLGMRKRSQELSCHAREGCPWNAPIHGAPVSSAS